MYRVNGSDTIRFSGVTVTSSSAVRAVALAVTRASWTAVFPEPKDSTLSAEMRICVSFGP